jgi:hypothetical protein
VLHGEGLDVSKLTRNSVTTLRDIQLAITKEELMRTETGDEVERDHSLGTFISMGLEIEEAQCVFACWLCCRTLLTFAFCEGANLPWTCTRSKIRPRRKC